MKNKVLSDYINPIVGICIFLSTYTFDSLSLPPEKLLLNPGWRTGFAIVPGIHLVPTVHQCPARAQRGHFNYSSPVFDEETSLSII